MRTGLAGGSALACGLALLTVAPVRANDRTPADSDPNQVTVTATRTPIAVEDAPCTDAMSGEAFPRSVTITIGSRTLHGCGRDLPGGLP